MRTASSPPDYPSLAAVPAAVAAIVLLALGGTTAAQDDCAPVFEMHPEFGDFEVTIDPMDPDQNLLMAANIGQVFPDSPIQQRPIRLMRLSSADGRPMGSPVTIATNFTGVNLWNGPEFAYHPETGIGILYNGPSGIHGAWRPQGAWDNFAYGATGVPFTGEPPALPWTEPGEYPITSPAATRMIGVTKSRWYPGCYRQCFGLVTDPAHVGFGDALPDLGLLAGPHGTSIPHPAAEELILFSGCFVDRPESCAVFEVAVDGIGGLVPESLMQLTGVSSAFLHALVRAQIHPVTLDLIVFLLTTDTLAVYSADGAHQRLSLVARTSRLPDAPEHLRVIETPDSLVLHFLDRLGADRGSYLLIFDENGVGAPYRASVKASGAELVYLPRADRLALYHTEHMDNEEGERMMRCWLP